MRYGSRAAARAQDRMLWFQAERDPEFADHRGGRAVTARAEVAWLFGEQPDFSLSRNATSVW